MGRNTNPPARMRRSCLFALLVFCALPLTAAETTRVEFPVGPARDRLVFEHPAGWVSEVSGSERASTLELHGAKANEFVVLITALPLLPGKVVSEAEVADLARQMGESKLATALQKAVEIRAVKGEELFGSLFHLTDRNPEAGPGDFREVHSGPCALGPYLLSVTILTHSEDTATVEAAFRMLASARYLKAP